MIPLVSIIIPTFNRAHLISETLNSVLAQTYTNWECIIIDDGSTDATEELIANYIKKDSRFQYFFRPSSKQKGPSSCRNYGLEMTKGEFIIFLDSDDILANFSLSKRIEMFNKYPENNGLIFSTHFFEGNISNIGSLVNNDPLIENEENYLGLFLNYKFPFTVMSPIWKKNIFENVLFSEDLLLLEDVVFHIETLFLEKIRIKRVHIIDNYYRKPQLEKLSLHGRPEDLLKSLLFLLNSYNEKIIGNDLLKPNFSRFIKIIYKNAIINQVNSRNKNEVYSIASRYDYITKKEQVLFLLLSFICKIKLNEKKNIGMYRIMKYLNKTLIK